MRVLPRWSGFSLGLLLGPAFLFGQVSGNNIITTAVGADWAFPARVLPSLQAPLDNPSGLSVDAQGNLYFADYNPRLVMQISRDGLLHVVAGTGLNVIAQFGGLNGPAAGASLDQVIATAVDSAGSLYILSRASLVFKVAANGTLQTIGGVAYKYGFSGDGGPALAATFDGAQNIAVDSVGNIYVADSFNNRVRRISPDGIIQTVAGNGSALPGGDGGAATNTGLSTPLGLAVDGAGNLYVSDQNRVIKVTRDGKFNTVVRGIYAQALALDPAGNLLLQGTSQISKVSSTGAVVILAGTGVCSVSGDGGPAANATLCNTGFGGLAVDHDGNIFLPSPGSIREITPDGTIKTMAGNGGYQEVADGSPGLITPLNAPGRMAFDSKGNLFFAEKGKGRVRKLDTSGRITTVAGNAVTGVSSNAFDSFGGLDSVATDSQDNVYFGTSDGRALRLGKDGAVVQVWKSAGAHATEGIAVDASGNLYITDNLFIRRVAPNGTITTFAGNGQTGWDGDGGPALNASLHARQLTLDHAGNLYIVDCNDNLVNTCRVRRITSTGTITAIAGNGASGYAGEGVPAVTSPLLVGGSQVGFFDIALDGAGNLYIGESARIRMVTPNGIAVTIAGTGSPSDSGDGGPAIKATFFYPSGIALDSRGNLYFSATQSGKIRKILTQLPAIQAVATPLSFSANSGGAPPPSQSFLVDGSIHDIPFTVSTTGGGNWLTVVAGDPVNAHQGSTPRLIDVSVDPTNLNPATYAATITVSSGNALPAQQTVQVRFVVGPLLPAKLDVNKTNLSFAFPRVAAPRSQTVQVANTGAGPLAFTATAATSVSPSWLSITPVSGIATPASPVSLMIQANPASLPPGTYKGNITVSSQTTGSSRSVPVNMTISPSAQGMLLSLTGMSFLSVVGGGVVPPQSFGVLNIGTGAMDWSVSTSTLSGGRWLSATPGNGSTSADGSVPSVQVTVAPAGLLAGKYYGLVRLDSGTAANSPQVVTVTLEVLPPGASPGSVVQPAALQFQLEAGQTSTSAQELLVYNLNSAPVTFDAQLSGPGAGYYRVFPFTAPVSPSLPARVVVAPLQIVGRTSGSVPARLVFQFNDGSVRTADLRLVALPAGSAKNSVSPASGCAPTRLTPALSTLGQSFSVPVGWPVALSANVVDDCGNPLTTGAVTVSFSNGDPPLALESLKDGHWQATWQTGTTQTSGVTLTVYASDSTAQVTGTTQISGGFGSQQDPPVFNKASVVSAASPVSFVPLAPGGMISIFGSHLADGAASAPGIPLPTQMANAQVIVAGQLAPLLYVSDSQINALVPSVNTNTTQQVLVSRGLTYSQPVPIDVASAQPAIFTSAGAGIFIAYRTDGTPPFVVAPGNPASVGDVLVGYCAGLGATSPSVADGTGSPVAPVASTLNAVTASIGGKDAPVSFSGLVPGFVGLYQINTRVPAGVQPGDSVPVTITVAGQVSPVVTLAIR